MVLKTDQDIRVRYFPSGAAITAEDPLLCVVSLGGDELHISNVFKIFERLVDAYPGTALVIGNGLRRITLKLYDPGLSDDDAHLLALEETKHLETSFRDRFETKRPFFLPHLPRLPLRPEVLQEAARAQQELKFALDYLIDPRTMIGDFHSLIAALGADAEANLGRILSFKNYRPADWKIPPNYTDGDKASLLFKDASERLRIIGEQLAPYDETKIRRSSLDALAQLGTTIGMGDHYFYSVSTIQLMDRDEEFSKCYEAVEKYVRDNPHYAALVTKEATGFVLRQQKKGLLKMEFAEAVRISERYLKLEIAAWARFTNMGLFNDAYYNKDLDVLQALRDKRAASFSTLPDRLAGLAGRNFLRVEPRNLPSSGLAPA
jgi:hypothetical protein